MPSAPQAPERDAPGLPSQGLRTVVSLLLFIHLFAVAVVLISSATRPLGGEDPRRMLTQQLRAVPFLVPYMQYLFLDEFSNNRSYRLTHDERIDLDYVVQFDLTLKDGSTKRVILPPPGLVPGQRQHRMQVLANKAGQRLVREDLESILPRLLAQRMVKEYGATGGTVRILAHLVIEPENVRGTNLAMRDPMGNVYYETSYEARILVSGDQVSLLKSTASGEAAPSARGSSPTPPPPQLPTPQLPAAP